MEYYQMAKFTNNTLSIINIYLSQGANRLKFLNDLEKLTAGTEECFVVGDFNIDLMKSPDDMVRDKLKSQGFRQIVDFPTHISGGTLDHIYIKGPSHNVALNHHFPYYTDHAAISIS